MKTRIYVGLLACMALLLCLYVTPFAVAQSGLPTVTEFEVLGSASGVNSRGDIVGVSPTIMSHGFLMPKGDVTQIEQIDIENAFWTWLKDINDSGDMVGSYLDAENYHSFVLSAAGELTELIYEEGAGVQANGINDEGVVVGRLLSSAGMQAFRWWKGEFTILDNYPEALATIPQDINNKGDVVGLYFDGMSLHGYMMSTAYGFTPIDVPGSISTEAASINARGDIVGTCTVYADPGNPDPMNVLDLGYVLRDGVYTTFMIPDEPTQFYGINKKGDIVGHAGFMGPMMSPGHPFLVSGL